MSWAVTHSTIGVWHPDENEEIQIDVDLAPLMAELWQRGILTLNSCQDNVPAGYCWIEFLSAEHAEDFLTRVAGPRGYRGGGLQERLLREYRNGRMLEGAWQFSAHVQNLGLRYGDDRVRRRGKNQIVLTISVRFPRCDLPLVLERIRQSPAIFTRPPSYFSLFFSSRGMSEGGQWAELQSETEAADGDQVV